MLKSKYLTIIIVIAVAFIGLSLLNLREPIENLNAEIGYMNQKLTEVQGKNYDASHQTDLLQNESYVKRQLRSKLNYKKVDEDVVLIYRIQPTLKEPKSSNFLVHQYNKVSSWFKNLIDK